MTLNLVLNSNNVVTGSSNSRYSYSFIGGTNIDILDEAEMCVSNITIPYSWFNFSKAYGNNKFVVQFPRAGTSLVFSVMITDGFYTIDDINAYLQQFCIQNSLYLINSAGQYVYYMVFLYNPSTYGIQLICSLVPTSLPAGWTAPAGFVFPTAPSRCPQLLLQSSDGTFNKMVGFEYGTYPVSNFATYNVVSTLVPVGSIVNSLICRCSLVNNNVGFPSDILDTVPITATFGSNINYSPPALKWVKMSSGSYQKLEILFVDQNLNSINILDSNVCISILINNKGKQVTELFIPKLAFRD